MNPDIFISYKREDLALVKIITPALIQHGWNVWWDHDIPAGKDYDTVIQDNISDARCVIVLWSDRSINSRNVKDEANVGLERNVLIPVLVGNVKAPIGFRMIQAVLCKNTDSISAKELEEIIYQVKLMIGEPGSEPHHIPQQPTKKNFVTEPAANLSGNVKANPWQVGNSSANNQHIKKTIIGISLLALFVSVAYGVMSILFTTGAEKQSSTVQTLKQTPPAVTAEVQEPIVEQDTVEPEVHEAFPEMPAEKEKSAVVEKPKKKAEPVKEKETVAQPIAEPVKPKPQIRNDLNGRWRADDNRIWIIEQSGSNVTISFCDENGKSCDMAQGTLSGRELSFHSPRRGKDRKGSFTISDDFKRMNGKTNIAFGLSNRITVTKID